MGKNTSRGLWKGNNAVQYNEKAPDNQLPGAFSRIGHMPENLLMQVEKSVSLTGLGVLLLTQHATPLLESFELYTQWRVQLVFPDGGSLDATAGVEEVSRPADSLDGVAVEMRALLLAQEELESVPTGTRVYLLTPEASF